MRHPPACTWLTVSCSLGDKFHLLLLSSFCFFSEEAAHCLSVSVSLSPPPYPSLNQLHTQALSVWPLRLPRDSLKVPPCWVIIASITSVEWTSEKKSTSTHTLMKLWIQTGKSEGSQMTDGTCREEDRWQWKRIPGGEEGQARIDLNSSTPARKLSLSFC